MRTFFIVFLPYIALFAVAILVGLAVLWIGSSLVRNVFIPYRKARQAEIEEVTALRAWKTDAENVLAEIVTSNWDKQVTGDYKLQLPSAVADELLQLHNPYALTSGRKRK
jgi:hypothetical protein